MLLVVHTIVLTVPAHPIIALALGAVGVYIVVRLAGRFLEMLPG